MLLKKVSCRSSFLSQVVTKYFYAELSLYYIASYIPVPSETVIQQLAKANTHGAIPYEQI